MSTGAVVARILTQYSDKGSKQAQKDIQKLGKKIDAFGKKAAKSFGLAAAGTAALAVKIGKDSVKAAIEDNKSQATLAKTLYSTVGATDAVIASVEEYIGKQQMLANVSDTELRASFSKLVMSSGDVASAMAQQTLALDIAAGTGKDLALVSDAIAKAQQGNFAALKKVIPTLDANIVKNKDLGAALLYANKMFKGQAEAAANTDPLTRLSLAYGELQEKLGNVLLPSVVLFVDYLINSVFPELEYWIYLNEYKLQGALDSVVGNIKEVVHAFTNIYNIIQGINDLLPIGIGGWIQLAVAIKALTLINTVGTTALSIYAMRLSLASGSMTAAAKATDTFKTILGAAMPMTLKYVVILDKMKLALLGTAAAGTKLGVALRFIGRMMLAILPKPIWLLLAAITAVYVVAKKVFKVGEGKNQLSEAAQAAEYSMWKAAKTTTSMDDALNAYKKTQEKAVAKTKEQIEQERLLAASQAKTAAATKKTAAAEKLRDTVLARLKKLNAVPGTGKPKIGKGITPVSTLEAAEYDAINFRAAELLLLKQKDNQAELEKLKALKENIFLQGLRNTLSERYKDILTALADNEISSKDIATLAGKWGVTIEAAKAYIETIFAISDGTISDDEITDLAKSWGSTKAQAEKYLDFFSALNDGILSDAEIEKLKSKWGITEDQVRQYADFVGVVNDGKLTDTEIQKLMTKWKMTSDEVVAYILKIGSPVSYNEGLLTPAQKAELAWKSATAALAAYLALLAKGTGGATVVPIVPIVPVIPVIPKVTDPGGTTSNGNLIKALEEAAAASSAAAADYATAKAAGDMNAAAIAAAQVTPSAIAAQENGIIGAASIAAQLRAAEDALAAANAVANQANTLAAFRDKEARDLATSQAAAAAMDYDERFRHRAAQGVLSASAGSSSSSGVVVNLVVNGSVSTEQDLVQTIRTGLLRGQSNGQTLTLEAV